MAGNLTAMIAAIFSGSAVSTDPYFNYNTLLLSTTATNGQQNNTFLDSSTNNFTITRNPATGPNAPTQGTFSPFSQTGWSNYFDGTGDYLTIPDNAAFDLAAGDFLIETFVYNQSSTNFKMIMGQWNTGQVSYTLRQNASKWVFTYTTNGTTEVSVTGTSNQVLNAWTHLAVIRTGNTLGLFVNGTRETTASMTGVTIHNNTGVFSVGAAGNGGDTWVGYIGASRLVKTTLPSGYDATLTTCPVPTASFSPTATTSVIVCQSNRFVDNSNNNFTITPNGNTTVVPFSPFNPTSAWSALTVGGSGYFDGTGDYLTVANNAAFNFGTGDFTVEFWFYALAPAANSRFLSNAAYNASGIDISWESGSTRIAWYISSTPYVIPLPDRYAWHHVAFTRSGTTLNTYINGARANTYTNSSNITSANALGIGAESGGTNVTNSYISNLRLVKGTAVYTGATYTVPTTPLTAITNTSLLLNFTNSGIYDATAKSVLETVGNAQVSTTTSQWPSTSMSFNGTTDYLQVNTASDLYNLSSGNWTIEAWVYRTGTNQMSPISYLNGSGTTLNGWAIEVNRTSAGTLYFASYNASTGPSGSVISAGNLVPLNTWTYIAVTCVGTTVTLYVNGTNVGSGARGTIGNDSSCRLRIGGMNYTTVRYWQGYIQDPRITKGYARTITTPTAAFPVQ